MDVRRAVRENGVAVVLMAILALVVADGVRRLLAGYPIGVDLEIPCEPPNGGWPVAILILPVLS